MTTYHNAVNEILNANDCVKSGSKNGTAPASSHEYFPFSATGHLTCARRYLIILKQPLKNVKDFPG